ncbi:MAG: translocation/assembly module TamB domain-containing protein [gamma proteobacterium symbiont of Taylorina sp.]|nr:translocation/assembly module TamB domain-containing protein [gamma proteobacterium symbiont of Taylorina sp.]
MFIKFLKISVKLLLSIIIILFLSVFFIVGTHSGTQWLLETGNKLAGSNLTYTKMQGHLLGNIQFFELEYNDQAIHLKCNNLLLSWQPKKLLQGHFELDKLVINSLYFEQKTISSQTKVDTEAELEDKILLTDVILPIDVSINEFKVSDIQLITTAEKKPILIDLISAKINAKDSTVNIHHIELKAADIHLSANGIIDLLNNYPLKINTHFSSNLAALPKISLTGLINGDLQQLEIRQKSKGDIEGQINIVLQHILSKPVADLAINISGHGSYARTKFIINGKVDQKLDLKWNIEAPQLKLLIPDMEGAVSAKGIVSGTQTKPLLEGFARLNKISMDNNLLNKANLDFSLSTEKNYTNKLKLSIDKMSSGENHVQDLLLTIDGSIDKHNIILKSLVLENQLAININGAYKETNQQWQGSINQLNIKGKALGSWQQKAKTPLLIAADKVVLDKLCLSDKRAILCAHGQWKNQQSSAKIQLSQINLSRFKEFLPKEIDELNGDINIDAELTMQDLLKASVDIEIKPGIFSYMIEANKRIRLKHKNTKISAHYNEKDVLIDWHLSLGEHGFSGNLALPRAAVDKDINSAALKGNIKLDIKELGLISALVPEINEADGFINADLKLAGQVSEPVITGVAQFISEKISIPLVGVEYTKINFKMTPGIDKQIGINGQFYSGNEKITIYGSLNPDSAKKWPANISISGNNFQLIDLPDVEVFISPDINIIHDLSGINIKGKLSIPQAGIYVKELPEGTKSASDDVVIVGKNEEEEKKTATRINLDMAILLGNKVHVKAFGLDTHLNGKINIKQVPGQLPVANGEITTLDGTFRAYGQDLIIEQGRIFYAGGFLDDPGLNIKAGKDIDNTTVGVMVNGSAKNILLETYSSDPNLSSKDITSLLITGQKFDASGSAKIYAGTELSDELSVGVNLGGEAGSEAVVRYKLGKNMHIEATSSSEKSAGDFVYTIEIE